MKYKQAKLIKELEAIRENHFASINNLERMKKPYSDSIDQINRTIEALKEQG